jgi:hypothetical protein
MTPKEKALDLFSTFRFAVSFPNNPLGEDKDRVAKICASMAVAEIEEALADYGRGDSLELQNMDSEFRFWEQVEKEIEQLDT